MAQKKIDKEEKNALKEVIEAIKEKFGEGAIMKLKDAKSVNVDAVPTGSFSLDLALGVGGAPRGRVIEIFGSEGSGKTTLALHILAEIQKKKGIGAFIDAEHALDPDYAKKIGVNINELLISQPDSGEQALQIVERLVRSNEVGVVVIDSVAALVPKTEVAGEVGDFQIGLQARLMSQALRILASVISKTTTSVIFLNQTRMKIGIRFGNPVTTPGGMALKFYSSVRIELRRIAQIKSGDNIVGSRIRAKIVKNKVAPPFKTAEFDIYHNEGISYLVDIIHLGTKEKVIQRAGSWFQYNNLKLGQGIEGAKKYLKEHPDIVKKIKKEILEKIKN